VSQTVSDEDDDGNAASRRPRARQEPAPLIAEDAKRIENAKVAIAKATSRDELKMVGDVLKTETSVVQSAVRSVYRDRYNALETEGTTNADHRSNEAAAHQG
jgi:hypothetical protein